MTELNNLTEEEFEIIVNEKHRQAIKETFGSQILPKSINIIEGDNGVKVSKSTLETGCPVKLGYKKGKPLAHIEKNPWFKNCRSVTSAEIKEKLVSEPINYDFDCAETKPVEFISKEDYEDLKKDWENIWPGRKAKVYQEYRRIEPRCKFFVKHGLPYLSGKRVLEIGANAGLQGYHIDKVAESYVGVEPGNKISVSLNPKTDYFLQAKKTEERMSDNAKFVNLTIHEFIAKRHNFKYNAFFASYALYHFADPELNLLKEYVFPECDTVVIQTRHQRRPTKHNKWKFWRPSQVERFFTRMGFNCVTINQVEPGEFKSKRPKPHNGFSLQICTRLGK